MKHYNDDKNDLTKETSSIINVSSQFEIFAQPNTVTAMIKMMNGLSNKNLILVQFMYRHTEPRYFYTN